MTELIVWYSSVWHANQDTSRFLLLRLQCVEPFLHIIVFRQMGNI